MDIDFGIVVIPSRCPAYSAQIRQVRPASGHSFLVTFSKSFQVVPSSLGDLWDLEARVQIVGVPACASKQGLSRLADQSSPASLGKLTGDSQVDMLGVGFTFLD